MELASSSRNEGQIPRSPIEEEIAMKLDDRPLSVEATFVFAFHLGLGDGV